MVAIGWTQEPERQRGKLLTSVWQDKEDKTGIGKVKYVTQRQHNTTQGRAGGTRQRRVGLRT